MSKRIRIVRPNLGNPLILEPNGLNQFEITVAYIKEWNQKESDVPYLSTARVKELLEQNYPRIKWGNIDIPLKIFRVHSKLQHPPYVANYSNVRHARTSLKQQYRNGFRWEMRVDVGIDNNDIEVLRDSLGWPNLLNLTWHGHNTNKHALYVHETLKHSSNFTVLHITDTHISQRNDRIPELLCQVRNKNECETLKSKYNNYNDNLRAFIKEANRRVKDENKSVIVVLTGDIVDYHFDGYWDGKFICGQGGQNAPDRRREATGSAWGYSNIEKFREIILGEDNKGERLCCPIFTVLGNHDYYMNEILLNFEFGSIFKIKDRDSYDAFGLNPEEGREYDFWAFPRQGGKEKPIAERKTFKEIIRTENVNNNIDMLILKNWKASLVDFAGDWSYWLIKPRSKQLTQYLCTVNYDIDFNFHIGNHHFLCLNTSHDVYPSKEQFIAYGIEKTVPDRVRDYCEDGPHNRGITDEHIRLLKRALQGTQEKTILVFTHSPFVGIEKDDSSEEIQSLYEKNLKNNPNRAKTYLNKLYGLSINELNNIGFRFDGKKYFKSGARDPLLNFSCSEGKVTEFLGRMTNTAIDKPASVPFLIFSGHTHKVHEFRLEKIKRSRLSDKSNYKYFIDDYSKKYFSYSESIILLVARLELLRSFSPLLFTSGALKNKKPQYREIMVREQSLSSLEMKEITTIEKTANFAPGCQTVALRAHNGQFVCAEDGGNGELVANRNSAREWETFEIVNLENDRIALKACNGKFVRAEGGGGSRLKSDKFWIRSHEIFLLVGRGGNKYALRAHNGQYVCAEGGGGKELIANRKSIREWEIFELVEL